MDTIANLPSRPLRERDIAPLCADDRLDAVPYGGIPDADSIRICAIKVATDDTAHALGVDDSDGRWTRLASVDADDLVAADRRLDTALDEWVQTVYGGEFRVLKSI
jgi:hypothetical protein